MISIQILLLLLLVISWGGAQSFVRFDLNKGKSFSEVWPIKVASWLLLPVFLIHNKVSPGTWENSYSFAYDTLYLLSIVAMPATLFLTWQIAPWYMIPLVFLGGVLLGFIIRFSFSEKGLARTVPSFIMLFVYVPLVYYILGQ